MMNLFSLYNSNKFLLRIVITIAVLLYALLSYGFDVILFMAALLVIIINLKDYLKQKNERRWDKQVNLFAKKMADGEVEYRITDYKSDTVSQDTINNLNAAADQIETFMYEVKSSFNYAQQLIFYRKPFSKGLKGIFLNSLNSVDNSLELMQQRYKQRHISNLYSSLSDLKTCHLLNNIETSQSDIAVVNNELTIVELATQNAANSALASKQSVSKVIENTRNIVEKISHLKISSAELDESSAEIADIITFISGIADQTNLLALNASIEAARAGEFGRGFSVVADEIRSLASNTKKSTAKINSIINRVVNSSNNISGESALIDDYSSVSYQLVSDFDQNFSEFSDVAQRTSESIAHSRMISSLTLAKLDHILYMQRAYRAIEMGADSKEAQLVHIEDDESGFGQWLASDDGGNKYSHLPSYEKLFYPHKAVHLYVNVMTNMLKGDWENNLELQEQLLLNMKCAESNSVELLLLLGKLVEEKKHFESTDEDAAGEISLF